MTKLSPQHFTFNELLQGRLFRIPDYQRAYSWGEKERRDLFNDIVEVIGSASDHFMATIVGLRGKTRRLGADQYSEVSLVDGQQRITTLIILLKAIEKALDETDPTEGETKLQLKRVLIKADDHNMVLLQTNHDSSNLFAEYMKQGSIKKLDSKTSADANVIDAAGDCEKFVADCQTNHTLIDLLSTIKNQLTVIYHEIDDESAVYRVFEVLNSRGLEVKWLDKTKSQLLGRIYEFVDSGSRDESLQQQKTVWQSIYRELGFQDQLGDEALRFAGTWKCNTKPSKILADRAASEALLEMAGKDIASLSDAGNWLKTVVEKVVALTKEHKISPVLRTRQARFLAIAIKLREFDEKTEQVILKAWENLTFRIFSLAGKDSRSSVGDYVRLGYEIVNDKLAAKAILKKLGEIGEGYSMADVTKKNPWKKWYPDWAEEIRYVLYKFEEEQAEKAGTSLNTAQWLKVWASKPSDSIEHILPQSSKKSFVHDLGNLCLLAPGVNSSLGAKAPKDKAERYVSCGLDITISVGKQIQKSQKWDKSDVIARSKEISDFIKRQWAD